MTQPWVCRYCGHHFPVDSLNTRHEPVCPMRPKEDA
jgi:hypothetical protein